MIKKIGTAIGNFFRGIGRGVNHFFRSIGQHIAGFYRDIREGDCWVKLSLLLCGAGYIARKQYIKGFLVTLLQAAVMVLVPVVFWPYMSKLGTLGTVQAEKVYNPETMKNEWNDFDNSFKVLLFGIIGIVICVVAIVLYVRNIRKVRAVEVLARSGKPVPTFRQDVSEMFNRRFHVTLLSMPVLGVVTFTIIPLLVMICIAFTNYDKQHLVPSNLFTWVGLKNITALFSTTADATFGYAFGQVLSWTLIWAFFATFTNYFGGILLAMFINNRRTRVKKLWRTLFVIAIAVPQFVSLMLVRSFFADQGIVNTICNNLGITDFLKQVGLVPQGLGYIPFLTKPGWAKVMIILINMWVGIPYLMLIATGVLINIPTDMLEAARIDGASPWQSFRSITMPYMLFVTGPYLVSQFVGNINNFNVIWLLSKDVYTTSNQLLANANAQETDLLVTWLFRLTQEQSNYKMASVIGILVFVVSAAITLIAFGTMIKGDKEENFQ